MNAVLRSALAVILATLAGGCSFFVGAGVYTNPDHRLSDLGYLQIGMPPIPEFPSSDWINAKPETADRLKGKVVLIDFWDYTSLTALEHFLILKNGTAVIRKTGW